MKNYQSVTMSINELKVEYMLLSDYICDLNKERKDLLNKVDFIDKVLELHEEKRREIEKVYEKKMRVNK